MTVFAACSSSPPPCKPFDLTIPATSPGANVVWTGNEYLLLVAGRSPITAQSPTDNVIQVVTSDGQMGSVFATVPLSEGTIWDLARSLAWSGSTLGTLVETMTPAPAMLQLLRFDGDGKELGTTTLTEAAIQYPQLVWADDRFVASWLSMNNSQLNIVEISSDGSASAPIVITQGTGFIFNTLRDFAASSKRYVAVVSDSYLAPTFVLVDRASHDTSMVMPVQDAFAVSTRNDEIAFATGLGTATIFQDVDTSDQQTTAVQEPLGATTAAMVPTASGFGIYGLGVQDPSTMMCNVEFLDVDASGTARGASSTVATFPCEGSFVGPNPVTRDNGYAANVAYGPGPFATQRLIQQCK
ncbi:MAG TPA: hypothetical protein VGF94_22790 [Kofleriaceae bacterium]|jgi:hypothetical protein